MNQVQRIQTTEPSTHSISKLYLFNTCVQHVTQIQNSGRKNVYYNFMKHLDNLHDLLVQVILLSDFFIKLFYSKKTVPTIKRIKV